MHERNESFARQNSLITYLSRSRRLRQTAWLDFQGSLGHWLAHCFHCCCRLRWNCTGCFHSSRYLYCHRFQLRWQQAFGPNRHLVPSFLSVSSFLQKMVTALCRRVILSRPSPFPFWSPLLQILLPDASFWHCFLLRPRWRSICRNQI